MTPMIKSVSSSSACIYRKITLSAIRACRGHTILRNEKVHLWEYLHTLLQCTLLVLCRSKNWLSRPPIAVSVTHILLVGVLQGFRIYAGPGVLTSAVKLKSSSSLQMQEFELLTAFTNVSCGQKSCGK